MFFLVDCVQRRYNSRSVLELSGILHITPNLGISLFVMCILYSGIPGTMKFVCEFYLFSQLLNISLLGTFILLVFANFIGVIGFCKCWYTVIFGMSQKYSKKRIVDLTAKEIYIIFFCVFVLIATTFSPTVFF